MHILRLNFELVRKSGQKCQRKRININTKSSKKSLNCDDFIKVRNFWHFFQEFSDLAWTQMQDLFLVDKHYMSRAVDDRNLRTLKFFMLLTSRLRWECHNQRKKICAIFTRPDLDVNLLHDYGEDSRICHLIFRASRNWIMTSMQKIFY